MEHQFEVRHLAAIDALADELHFGRAAARLHVARPAFSRTIQQLERRLGCSLVDRTTRTVSLTPAGVDFARRARELLDLADEAARSANDIASGRTGRLRIGFTGPAMVATVPSLLRRLRETSPGVRFEVRELPTAVQLALLESGDLDVGFFLDGGPVGSTIETRKVAEDRAMVGVPADHPLAGRDAVRLGDVADETLILFPRERNPALYDEVVALASSDGRRSLRIEEASSRSVAAGLVAAGVGVSTFTESMAGMCGPRVKLVPQVEPERSTTVLAGWRPGTPEWVRQTVDANRR